MKTEKAILAQALTDFVGKALACGIPHYDKSGKRLVTIIEVIEALVRDGSVEVREV